MLNKKIAITHLVFRIHGDNPLHIKVGNTNRDYPPETPSCVSLSFFLQAQICSQKGNRGVYFSSFIPFQSQNFACKCEGENFVTGKG
jgi:hypothetical protein